MSKPVILCDVDEVCADLISEWLRRYNDEWNDSLTTQDITEWDMAKLVKPECGKKIYDILRQPYLYDSVKPVPGAREGIRALRKAGRRVVFVTSCVIGSTDNKMRWLVRQNLLPNESTPKDFIAAKDKALVRGEVLIDDAPHNVVGFPGRTILFDSPHNRKAKAPDLRAAKWDEVVQIALDLTQ